MKYTININQKAIIENGLFSDNLDIIDFAIIDYILTWFFADNNKNKKIISENEEYTWINYNHLIKELPLLRINDKGGISHRITKLKKEGFLKTFQMKNGHIFIRPTEKIAFLYYDQNGIDEGLKTSPKDELVKF